jgi:hypothetical protein
MHDCIAYRLTGDAKESRGLGLLNPFTLRTNSLDKPSFIAVRINLAAIEPQ